MTNTISGYRIRVYVGPCWVDQMAAMIEAAGFTVDVIGTEHIHYRAPYVDGWGALSACDAVAQASGLHWISKDRLYTVINTY